MKAKERRCCRDLFDCKIPRNGEARCALRPYRPTEPVSGELALHTCYWGAGSRKLAEPHRYPLFRLSSNRFVHSVTLQLSGSPRWRAGPADKPEERRPE